MMIGTSMATTGPKGGVRVRVRFTRSPGSTSASAVNWKVSSVSASGRSCCSVSTAISTVTRGSGDCSNASNPVAQPLPLFNTVISSGAVSPGSSRSLSPSWTVVEVSSRIGTCSISGMSSPQTPPSHQIVRLQKTLCRSVMASAASSSNGTSAVSWWPGRISGSVVDPSITSRYPEPLIRSALTPIASSTPTLSRETESRNSSPASASPLPLPWLSSSSRAETTRNGPATPVTVSGR